MSEFKVFIEKVECFEHPNADKLSLYRIGTFQLVAGKDQYKTGDLVCFAPKRSILPESLRPYYRNEETNLSYLRGPNEDRVGSIRLRGEESEGIIIPYEWWTKVYKEKASPILGEDISDKLGITEYIPGRSGTPGTKTYNFQGDIVQKVDDVLELSRFVRHDVENYGIFKNAFVLGEPVVVTEKIHGSQINIIKDRYGKVAVTSKGRAEKNLVLRKYPVSVPFSGRGFWNKIKSTLKWLANIEGPINEYWKIALDNGLIDFINHEQFCGKEVQIIGEYVPCQKGFSYGCSEKKVLVFRVVVGTIEQPYFSFFPDLMWVPLLYKGPYDPEKILPLANGMETVSKRSLHIREGIVITPEVFRKTVRGVPLILKILNKKYKQNDEDIV